jgi:hypothetical protein
MEWFRPTQVPMFLQAMLRASLDQCANGNGAQAQDRRPSRKNGYASTLDCHCSSVIEPLARTACYQRRPAASRPEKSGKGHFREPPASQ